MLRRDIGEATAAAGHRRNLAAIRPHAADRLHELGLAVAGDADDRNQLARPHREARAAHGGKAEIALDGEIVDPQHRLAERPGRPAALAEVAIADDQAGKAADIDLGGRAAMHDAARAHHHEAVRDLQHLVELVADQHHGAPRSRDPPDDLEQAHRLGRREHGGRLVEDQELCAGRQGAQDLELLADRERHLPDLRGKIDRRSRDPPSTRPDRRPPCAAAAGGRDRRRARGSRSP